MYNEVINRREQEEANGGKFKAGILTEVWNIVKEKIPYNEAVVEELSKEAEG